MGRFDMHINTEAYATETKNEIKGLINDRQGVIISNFNPIVLSVLLSNPEYRKEIGNEGIDKIRQCCNKYYELVSIKNESKVTSIESSNKYMVDEEEELKSLNNALESYLDVKGECLAVYDIDTTALKTGRRTK